MTLHREGKSIILYTIILISVLELGNILLYKYTGLLWLLIALSIGLSVLFLLVVQFFRIPERTCMYTENDVMSPADGKIVVIEEVMETEYFHDRRIQVSIFMSPLDVHANYNPVSGIMTYVKYHPGLFLVAWHPKSSTDNERCTFVIEHVTGKKVLFRQIAGAMARRIRFYVKEGQEVRTGEEFGFIKFGSRVDIFLPLGTKIDVKLGEKVKAKLTRIGELK